MPCWEVKHEPEGQTLVAIAVRLCWVACWLIVTALCWHPLIQTVPSLGSFCILRRNSSLQHTLACMTCSALFPFLQIFLVPRRQLRGQFTPLGIYKLTRYIGEPKQYLPFFFSGTEKKNKKKTLMHYCCSGEKSPTGGAIFMILHTIITSPLPLYAVHLNRGNFGAISSSCLFCSIHWV